MLTKKGFKKCENGECLGQKKEALTDQYFRVQSSSFSSFIVLKGKGHKSSELLIIQPI